MTLIDFIGYAAAIIAALIFLPQVIHTIKSRDTKGLSLITYILLTVSNSLWMTYGVLTADYAIIFAQACLWPMGVVILGYKIKIG
jgi:MtN3 and saliva related transmembrane protein